MIVTFDIHKIIEVETGQAVTDDTSLDSLDVDSLEFLQLLLQLGEATGKYVPDAKIAAIRTVGDLVRELS
jgi:acyl carrier protein